MSDFELGLLFLMIGFKMVFGAIGGVMICCLRNDTIEKVKDVELSRASWMIIAFGYALALFSLNTFPAMSTFWAMLSALCAAGWTAVIWSMPHGPCLRGPTATLRWDPDPILYWVLRVFDGKEVADRATRVFPGETKQQLRGVIVKNEIGLPVWMTYGFIRYCVPCLVIASFIPHTLVWLAGPMIMFGYWPLGHYWYRNFDSEPQFVGAFVAGFFFYGLI